MITADISVCPTDLECSSDLMDEGRLLAAIRESLEGDFPDDEIIFNCLQVGYRQGDAWCVIRLNGKKIAWNWVDKIDCSDESLYS